MDVHYSAVLLYFLAISRGRIAFLLRISLVRASIEAPWTSSHSKTSLSAAVKDIGYQPNTLSSFIEPLDIAFGPMINHKFGSIGGVTSDNCIMERLPTVIFGRVINVGMVPNW